MKKQSDLHFGFPMGEYIISNFWVNYSFDGYSQLNEDLMHIAHWKSFPQLYSSLSKKMHAHKNIGWLIVTFE